MTADEISNAISWLLTVLFALGIVAMIAWPIAWADGKRRARRTERKRRRRREILGLEENGA